MGWTHVDGRCGVDYKRPGHCGLVRPRPQASVLHALEETPLLLSAQGKIALVHAVTGKPLGLSPLRVMDGCTRVSGAEEGSIAGAEICRPDLDSHRDAGAWEGPEATFVEAPGSLFHPPPLSCDPESWRSGGEGMGLPATAIPSSLKRVSCPSALLPGPLY